MISFIILVIHLFIYGFIYLFNYMRARFCNQLTNFIFVYFIFIIRSLSLAKAKRFRVSIKKMHVCREVSYKFYRNHEKPERAKKKKGKLEK